MSRPGRDAVRSLRVIAVVLCAGCAATPATPLPTHAWSNPQEALAIMDARAATVTTFSTQCRIVMEDAEGNAVRLDGAVAARPPDHLRLRAAKMGANVIDLVWTPDGIWVRADRDDGRIADLLEALDPERLADAWRLVAGGPDVDAGTFVRETDRGDLELSEPCDGGSTTLFIDGATLTTRRFERVDDDGTVLDALDLDAFRPVDATVLPHRMVGTSGDRVLRIELFDVEVNPELPDAAFRPPARAERWTR